MEAGTAVAGCEPASETHTPETAEGNDNKNFGRDVG